MHTRLHAALLTAAAVSAVAAPLAQASAATQAGAGQLASSTPVYVFGDSAVEQGNLYALPGLERPDAPYYSKDGFSRESNGPVWVEYLAPGIQPVLGAAAGATRVNYAYSGATSGTDNIVGVAGTGLRDQVNAFAGQISAGAPRPSADALVVVAAGTNDFIRDLGEVDLRTTSSEVTGNLTAAVRQLAGLGARRVLVEDIPTFIHGPEFNNAVPAADRPQLVSTITQFMAAHNAAQTAALAKLNSELAATDVVTVKISKLFDHVRANAAALGFQVIDRACYNEAAGTLCSTDPAAQNAYLFFDNLHLTTKAQALQADYYRALLGQLSGTAHHTASGIAQDTAGTARAEAAAERSARRGIWLAPEVPNGFFAVGDASYTRVREGGDLTARGNRQSYRFGVGHGDGESWTVRVVGARQQADIKHADSANDLAGWSVTAAGERRWGNLRLGAAVSHVWGEVEGMRRMPVALMAAEYEAKVSGVAAELEAGYLLRAGKLSVLPSAWARYERARIDDYAETGDTGLEMSFNKRTLEAVYAGASATLAYDLSPVIRPRLTASYERRLTRGGFNLQGQLVDNSADAITARVRPFAEYSAVVEPGLDVSVGKATLSLTGTARLDEPELGARARLMLRF